MAFKPKVKKAAQKAQAAKAPPAAPESDDAAENENNASASNDAMELTLGSGGKPSGGGFGPGNSNAKASDAISYSSNAEPDYGSSSTDRDSMDATYQYPDAKNVGMPQGRVSASKAPEDMRESDDVG